MVEDNTLRVVDAAGHELWRHRFPFAIWQNTYGPDLATPVPVVITDLEGDGPPEVLVLTYSVDPHDKKLYVFEAGGTKRFEYQPTRRVTYGAMVYGPPFPVAQFIVTRDNTGTAIWVVSTHHVDFPAVIAKLAPDGRELAQYWSDGHVAVLQPATLGGRSLMLAGGTKTELKRATLTVLDAEHPSGSAPSASAKYRCSDCPQESPLQIAAFPQQDTYDPSGGQPFVNWITVDEVEELVTAKIGSIGIGKRDPGYGMWSFYELDEEFRLKRAQVSDAYKYYHAALERAGQLNHPFSADCEQQLLPALSWTGSGWSKVWLRGR
jgi:hypothetical protein